MANHVATEINTARESAELRLAQHLDGDYHTRGEQRKTIAATGGIRTPRRVQSDRVAV